MHLKRLYPAAPAGRILQADHFIAAKRCFIKTNRHIGMDIAALLREAAATEAASAKTAAAR